MAVAILLPNFFPLLDFEFPKPTSSHSDISFKSKRFINPTFSPGQISGTVHGVGTAI
jgi:hypothetical protein